MKKIFCLLFVLFLAPGVWAQTVDKTVETIRSRYNDVSEKARLAETDGEQGEFGELVMNELKINSRAHQWRAVGIYRQTFKFFYKGGDSEARPYPDKLVFVVGDRRISDRRYREEWLFSDTGSLLLFTYRVESEQPATQSRIYFSGGKAIRIVDGDKVTTRMSALDLKYANRRAEQGRRVKELFTRSINL